MNSIVFLVLAGIVILAIVIFIVKVIYNKNRKYQDNTDESPGITIAEAIKRAVLSLLAAPVLVELTFDTIVKWFKAHQELKLSDADNIAFTLLEKPADGNYKIVQGIFNKRTNKLLDGIKYEAKKIDENLAEAHRNEALVVYE